MNIRYIVRTSDNIVIEIQNSRSASNDEYIVEDVKYISPLQDVSGIYLYEVKNNKVSLRYINLLPEYISWVKNNKLLEIKQKANNNIISVYPEWKQINLSADREFALGFIAKFKNKSNDTINSEITDKLYGLSIDELKTIRNNFSILNIIDLITSTDIPYSYIEQVKLQYQNIVNSYIAYVLIKSIRYWSNAKEELLNNCQTIEEINLINLEDCIIL